jgi:hypothetical protein
MKEIVALAWGKDAADVEKKQEISNQQPPVLLSQEDPKRRTISR